jgi:hypothetical protein
MAAKRTSANPADLYRIVAAEAHSWSSLLLEDERGQRYLYVVGTRTLAEVAAASADDLLARRVYRTWRGDRAWAPLDQLPPLRHATEIVRNTGIAVGYVPEAHQGDAQAT